MAVISNFDILFWYFGWLEKGEVMGALSLKLPDELLKTSGRYAAALQIPRAEYIRRAIERMNRQTAARLRAKRLAEVSRRVRKESMRVNAEFAAVEGDPGAQSRRDLVRQSQSSKRHRARQNPTGSHRAGTGVA